jgi:outer membrane protein assembly factor BamD (BamD/ComL family)
MAYLAGCASISNPGAGVNSLFGSKEAKREEIARAGYEREEPEVESKPSGLTLEDLSPDNLTKTAKKLTGNGPNREVARQFMQDAETAYGEALVLDGDERFAKFEAAGKLYEQAAERWPDSALQQDALFKAGECAFFADRYPLANDFYEKLSKQYPNNRYMDLVDQRRFTIAQYWLGLNRQMPDSWWALNLTDKQRPWRDTRGYALRVFERIRVDDPTGRLSDDATLAAGNEHFTKGDFAKAESFYADLRKNYPTSEHQFTAHFLGLKSQLLSYRGANYVGEQLDHAEKLIRQMRKQFPADSEKEKEFLDRAFAEVRYKKAEREWSRAQYHERRREFRAAHIYYDTIVHDFADTPFAEQSTQRMAEIVSLPAVPPQKLPWLVSLFPESDKVKPLIQASQQTGGKKR